MERTGVQSKQTQRTLGKSAGVQQTVPLLDHRRQLRLFRNYVRYGELRMAACPCLSGGIGYVKRHSKSADSGNF